MERALNPRLEKETIYEIYRACRLCGAGAGYKMPIMQNVIDLEDTEINLSKKIRECLQIEVHSDDKMPPLICELCVDKVNDFYEFLELCRQTNTRTRLKLGLPMQTTPKGVPDSGDCILGDPAPVYINDSDREPLSKHKSKTKVKEKEKHKAKVKKESEKTKVEVMPYKDDKSRACRRTAPAPAPAAPAAPVAPVRVTRTSCAASDLNGKSHDSHKRSKPATKSIIKKDKEDAKEDDAPRLKRLRDKEVKSEIPVKRVKILVQQCSVKPSSKTKSRPAKHPASPASTKPQSSSRPAAPARRPASPASPPAVQYTCKICSQVHRSKGYHNHMRSHIVTFTKPSLACNACGDWFLSHDEASRHHRAHKHNSIPYKCRRCTGEFSLHQTYEEHFGRSQCVPYDEVPDARCAACWRRFATDRLLIEHACGGEDARPGGKCPKCNRTYVLFKNLRRHETTCLHRRRSAVMADPDVLESLKPLQIRVVRCDPLLKGRSDGPYDVGSVKNFGYDPNCTYPYKRVRVKTEPFDGMVKIQEEVKKEFCSAEYVYWDSIDSEKVDSLVTLSLKTIFSPKLLGRVPKKRRVKIEVDDFEKSIDVSSGDVSKNSEGAVLAFKDFNVTVNCEPNVHSGKVDLGKEKDSVNNFNDSKCKQLDSVIDVNTNVTKGNVDTPRLDNNKPCHEDIRTNSQANEFQVDDIEDFGNTDKINGNDTNDGFEDIDGDKLIDALNAQIGEDDDKDDKNGKDQHSFTDIKVMEQETSAFNKHDTDKCELRGNVSKNNCQEPVNDKQNEQKYFDSESSKRKDEKDNEMKEYKSSYDNDAADVNVALESEVKNNNFKDNGVYVPKDDVSEKNSHKSSQGENGTCEKLSLEDLLEKDLEKTVGLAHMSDDDYNFDV